MVLPVPSLSVVVSASGMYCATLALSPRGTLRLNVSFTAVGRNTVLNTWWPMRWTWMNRPDSLGLRVGDRVRFTVRLVVPHTPMVVLVLR